MSTVKTPVTSMSHYFVNTVGYVCNGVFILFPYETEKPS